MLAQHISAEQDANQDKIANPLNIRVFAFQPNDDFYSFPFEKRLKILEEQILLAKKSMQQEVISDTEQQIKNSHGNGKKSARFWVKNKINSFSRALKDKTSTAASANAIPLPPSPPSALFVAPEYLFKDLSELCYRRYYTQQQKNEFKNKLKELSIGTDMLIVPGTICWYKNAKSDPHPYYRNTAYFFYQGEVQKYKKKHPHTSYDFDYTDEGFLNFMDLRRVYFKSGQYDDPIKDFLGCKIGVEICLDSVYGSLFSLKKTLCIQLIIADGAKNFIPVNQEGVLLIKLERNKIETEIGRIKINTAENDKVELEPAIPLEIGADLTGFQFK
ncbi:hypothetical protein [Legionella maioricensis]|uniref:Carbon-nitrogen hydrolase n=1 Tax=Legionella maioricensis TaxID=2896528 RepID=A0A9X2CZW7_9GAMM|nr:hypothetical protein [Legionella maioricensis]MCL9683777.1 hypothetical protein [Legionella maioricensis]MCL9686624.1 hypothetical protein [Legionella maioricensis]